MNLWVIFLTGLTTGGLTCLAVQGGLLASALPKQIAVQVGAGEGKPARTLTSVQLPKDPWPIVYFLAAKLLAYTLLGFFLGALGAAFQITSTGQAIMQIAAGLFMLATAANMLNLHPIFRYVVIQPPKALTRLVRNQSKNSDAFTPAILGAMTIFIPCGTTQVMETLAISSGNPLMGALIMFAFVLGTSPTFFVLGFLVTRIRGQFQRPFTIAAAVLILLLGVVSLDGGLNLLGSPLAPSRIVAAFTRPGGFNVDTSKPPILANSVNGAQELTINVFPTAYTPNYLSARSGQPIRLRLITGNGYGCTRGFTIPSLGIQKILPDTGETVLDLPPQPRGTLFFTCVMGMYSGMIQIT